MAAAAHNVRVVAHCARPSPPAVRWLHRVTLTWTEGWLGRAGLHRVTPTTPELAASPNWLHRVQPARQRATARGTQMCRRNRRPTPVTEATFTVPTSAAEASAAGVPELTIETM